MVFSKGLPKFRNVSTRKMQQMIYSHVYNTDICTYDYDDPPRDCFEGPSLVLGKY